MTRKAPSTTEVTRSETATCTIVKARYPSGGHVALQFGDDCEMLDVGGSDDPEVCRHQAQAIQHWATCLRGETNSTRAARVADMLGRYNSVVELVTALEGK